MGCDVLHVSHRLACSLINFVRKLESRNLRMMLEKFLYASLQLTYAVSMNNPQEAQQEQWRSPFPQEQSLLPQIEQFLGRSQQLNPD